MMEMFYFGWILILTKALGRSLVPPPDGGAPGDSSVLLSFFLYLFCFIYVIYIISRKDRTCHILFLHLWFPYIPLNTSEPERQWLINLIDGLVREVPCCE